MERIIVLCLFIAFDIQHNVRMRKHGKVKQKFQKAHIIWSIAINVLEVILLFCGCLIHSQFLNVLTILLLMALCAKEIFVHWQYYHYCSACTVGKVVFIEKGRKGYFPTIAFQIENNEYTIRYPFSIRDDEYKVGDDFWIKYDPYDP